MLIGAAAALAVTGWALLEPHLYRLRRVTLPLLPSGAWPIRVLHLSDLHILPTHRRKIAWVSGLAQLRPDLVVVTGDTLSSPRAVTPALAAFGDLLDMPGAFVLGNNDFYAPEPKSPHRYLTRSTHVRRRVDLPWRELSARLVGRGWADVNNARAVVTVGRQRVALAGTNDAHTGRDRYELVAGPARPDAVIRIGVTHSPEPYLLDAFAADGYDLVLAGHTHGGQIRVPGIGALVTNCGLDRSRARGPSRWGASMWLHVSAGLGASPYLPVRLACPPEATLLTLVPPERAGIAAAGAGATATGG